MQPSSQLRCTLPAVTEAGGEYLPFDRFVDDEADATLRLIGMILQVLAEAYQIAFQEGFEAQLAIGIAFVPTGTIVGLKQILQQATRGSIVLGEAYGEAVRLRVAVHVEIAAVEVEVVSIRGTVGSRGPVVAVGADIVNRRAIEVAGGGQKVATNRKKSLGCLW